VKPLKTRRIPYQFSGKQFRNAIKFVFEMAEPPEDTGIRITFHFQNTVTFTGHADGDKVPFNPAEAPTVTTRAPINVPCDVEFVQAADDPTNFGNVIPSKLKTLLLDDEYQLVKDATFVVMNGDRYNRFYEEPSFGLFDVGLHTLLWVAENEL
jgi:hypothetical protein